MNVLIIGVGASALLFAAARAWLHEILIYPHDPQRADMVTAALPVLVAAIAVSGDVRHFMSASLNGTVLGTVTLNEGWQTVSLPAPARAWQIGVNALTLSLSTAVSPLESRESADRRRLSVAVDRLTVRSQ